MCSIKSKHPFFFPQEFVPLWHINILGWGIIIIIWHYNPLWVFTFSAKSLQVLLSLAASFQFLTFSFFRSSMTSSCHHCLGLPTVLVPIGFQSSSFPVGLAWSILWVCPSHLILCALMNLTISAPSIELSISMLFRILHILSIWCRNTFINKYLDMRLLFFFFNSWFRASWFNVNKRSNSMQQYADIYLPQSHSTCFGCHSTHHQEY